MFFKVKHQPLLLAREPEGIKENQREDDWDGFELHAQTIEPKSQPLCSSFWCGVILLSSQKLPKPYISHLNVTWKMSFLVHWWDRLVLWRVPHDNARVTHLLKDLQRNGTINTSTRLLSHQKAAHFRSWTCSLFWRHCPPVNAKFNCQSLFNRRNPMTHFQLSNDERQSASDFGSYIEWILLPYKKMIIS